MSSSIGPTRRSQRNARPRTSGASLHPYCRPPSSAGRDTDRSPSIFAESGLPSSRSENHLAHAKGTATPSSGFSGLLKRGLGWLSGTPKPQSSSAESSTLPRSQTSNLPLNSDPNDSGIPHSRTLSSLRSANSIFPSSPTTQSLYANPHNASSGQLLSPTLRSASSRAVSPSAASSSGRPRTNHSTLNLPSYSDARTLRARQSSPVLSQRGTSPFPMNSYARSSAADIFRPKEALSPPPQSHVSSQSPFSHGPPVSFNKLSLRSPSPFAPDRSSLAAGSKRGFQERDSPPHSTTSTSKAFSQASVPTKKQMVWDPVYGFTSQETMEREKKAAKPAPRNEVERVLGILDGIKDPLSDGTKNTLRLPNTISVPSPARGHDDGFDETSSTMSDYPISPYARRKRLHESRPPRSTLSSALRKRQGAASSRSLPDQVAEPPSDDDFERVSVKSHTTEGSDDVIQGDNLDETPKPRDRKQAKGTTRRPKGSESTKQNGETAEESFSPRRSRRLAQTAPDSVQTTSEEAAPKPRARAKSPKASKSRLKRSIQIPEDTDKPISSSNFSKDMPSKRTTRPTFSGAALDDDDSDKPMSEKSARRGLTKIQMPDFTKPVHVATPSKESNLQKPNADTTTTSFPKATEPEKSTDSKPSFSKPATGTLGDASSGKDFVPSFASRVGPPIVTGTEAPSLASRMGPSVVAKETGAEASPTPEFPSSEPKSTTPSPLFSFQKLAEEPSPQAQMSAPASDSLIESPPPASTQPAPSFAFKAPSSTNESKTSPFTFAQMHKPSKPSPLSFESKPQQSPGKPAADSNQSQYSAADNSANSGQPKFSLFTAKKDESVTNPSSSLGLLGAVPAKDSSAEATQPGDSNSAGTQPISFPSFSTSTSTAFTAPTTSSKPLAPSSPFSSEKFSSAPEMTADKPSATVADLGPPKASFSFGGIKQDKGESSEAENRKSVPLFASTGSDVQSSAPAPVSAPSQTTPSFSFGFTPASPQPAPPSSNSFSFGSTTDTKSSSAPAPSLSPTFTFGSVNPSSSATPSATPSPAPSTGGFNFSAPATSSVPAQPASSTLQSAPAESDSPFGTVGSSQGQSSSNTTAFTFGSSSASAPTPQFQFGSSGTSQSPFSAQQTQNTSESPPMQFTFGSGSSNNTSQSLFGANATASGSPFGSVQANANAVGAGVTPNSNLGSQPDNQKSSGFVFGGGQSNTTAPINGNTGQQTPLFSMGANPQAASNTAGRQIKPLRRKRG